jgi:uncharacterized protein (TIGR03067 family)
MMLVRFTLSLAVAFSLTALVPAAPAPLVKKDRNRAPDDLALMQGTWKMVEQGRPGMNNGQLAARVAILKRGDSQTKIKIEDGKFTYLYFNGQGFTPSTSYDLTIQPRSAPKTIDMKHNSGDYTITLKGIYKIDGNKLTILYVNTYESKMRAVPQQLNVERPTSFDSPSANAMQMVLEKE